MSAGAAGGGRIASARCGRRRHAPHDDDDDGRPGVRGARAVRRREAARAHPLDQLLTGREAEQQDRRTARSAGASSSATPGCVAPSSDGDARRARASPRRAPCLNDDPRHTGRTIARASIVRANASPPTPRPGRGHRAACAIDVAMVRRDRRLLFALAGLTLAARVADARRRPQRRAAGRAGCSCSRCRCSPAATSARSSSPAWPPRSSPAAAVPRRRSCRPRARAPRGVPRGGRLIAASLAVRPPPALARMTA